MHSYLEIEKKWKQLKKRNCVLENQTIGTLTKVFVASTSSANKTENAFTVEAEKMSSVNISIEAKWLDAVKKTCLFRNTMRQPRGASLTKNPSIGAGEILRHCGEWKSRDKNARGEKRREIVKCSENLGWFNTTRNLFQFLECLPRGNLFFNKFLRLLTSGLSHPKSLWHLIHWLAWN